MKKIYVFLLVAGITFSLSNCTYDDSALWNEMEQIKDRVSDLEESVLQTNEEIEALQSIVNALQNNLYICLLYKHLTFRSPDEYLRLILRQIHYPS